MYRVSIGKYAGENSSIVLKALFFWQKKFSTGKNQKKKVSRKLLFVFINISPKCSCYFFVLRIKMLFYKLFKIKFCTTCRTTILCAKKSCMCCFYIEAEEEDVYIEDYLAKRPTGFLKIYRKKKLFLQFDRRRRRELIVMERLPWAKTIFNWWRILPLLRVHSSLKFAGFLEKILFLGVPNIAEFAV